MQRISLARELAQRSRVYKIRRSPTANESCSRKVKADFTHRLLYLQENPVRSGLVWEP
jgi:hypothetical protein